MRLVRLLTTAAASSLLLVGVGIAAAPAHAAPTPATLYFGGVAASPTNCAGAVGIYSDAAHTSDVTALTGTNGNVTITNDCTTYAVAYTHTFGSGTIPGTAFNSGANSSTFTSLSGTGTFTLYVCPIGLGNGSAGNCLAPIPNNTFADTATFSLTGGGGGGGCVINCGSSSTADSTPAAVIQAFGKPSTGTCVEAAPESLNWGGASSGGWGESWAQWMNEGTGGFVCGRTLIYSNNLGHWIVA